MNQYFGDWDGIDGLRGDFGIDESGLKDSEVIAAAYVHESYEGDSYVLFKRDGKLYEVEGGHCSCYGLEGQWEPEETTAEALMHRIEKGDGCRAFGACQDAIAEALRPTDSDTR